MFRLILVAICLAACAPQLEAPVKTEVCDAPIGWEEIASTAEGGFLVIGELHGTEEVPAAFGEYICAVAAQGGRTLVGLEMSQSYQAILDDAKVSAEPRELLLSEMNDHWALQDGRSSEAMLDLVVKLLRTEGVTVYAFAAPLRTPIEKEAYELKKAKTTGAQRHQARSERMRNSLVGTFVGFDRAIVLTGNIHASKAGFNFLEGAENLAMLLPDDTLTLDNRYEAGEAWNTGHDHKSGANPVSTRAEGIPDGAAAGSMGVTELVAPRFDGYLYVGEVSASPPALERDTREPH